MYIQNHPSVWILQALHHEVFTAGALEARVCRTHPSVLILFAVHLKVPTAGALETQVCRTSAFIAPARKCLTLYPHSRVKSCYNPLRLGTVLSLSLQVDFVNTPRLYSDRATRLERLPIWPEMRFEPLNVCLTDRRLN